MSAEVFIDTNVFIHHLDSTDPVKHETAERIVREAIVTGHACISFQVIQEYINTATRKALKRSHERGMSLDLTVLNTVKQAPPRPDPSAPPLEPPPWRPTMTTCLTRFVAPALLAAAAISAHAEPIDLSSWSALTLDFPGGQSAGSWSLEPGNTAVKQVINADPSFFLNNQSQTSYRIDGTWQVLPGSGDDDYMGFAFGYQNSSNFYLFDWKKATQGYESQVAAEGMTIKRFTGATGSGLVDLSIGEFWENEDNLGDMTVLATNHSGTAGWVDNVLYSFHLDYNVTAGEFSILVKEGSTTLWEKTVSDSTFGAGQFAFFNNSQSGVRYAGFEQTTVVPEPGALALMLAGLGALAVVARRRAHDAH